MTQHNNQLHPNETNATLQLSRPVPPTLLRINADNQDKRAICIFWVIFFVVIVVVSIASAFLPNSTLYLRNLHQLKGTNLQNCDNPTQFDNNNILQCDPYHNEENITDNKVGVVMIDLDRLNQFAVVFFEFYVIDNSKSTQSIRSNVNISFDTLQDERHDDGLKYFHSVAHQKSQLLMNINFAKTSYIYGDDKRTVLGYRTPIFVARNFQDESFVLVTTFERNITDYTNIADISGGVLVVNPEFTKYTFVIRYIFFGFSLVAAIIYIARFRKIPISERILQQKLIIVLSVLTIFFNDPFYPITVLHPNKASSYFSVFFVINFIVFLIFFWIIFLDRIYYEDGQKETNLLNWKRFTYITITYILVLVLYTLFAFDYIEGLPIVPTQDLASSKFIVLQLIALIFVLAGFAYIVVSYIRLCIKVDQMLWRNQLFLFFSVFFIAITIALFFLNGFEINSLVGNRMLLLYTAMNMYTFYMQYMYSITSEETERAQRGQYEQQGGMLLQVGSGDGDCVDLQFDDLPSRIKEANNEQKIVDFVNRNKNHQLQNMNKMKKVQPVEEEYYSPKYSKNYENDLKKEDNIKIQPKIQIEEDKQTDFFQQYQKSEQDDIKYQGEKKKTKKQQKKDDFEQFSLGD